MSTIPSLQITDPLRTLCLRYQVVPLSLTERILTVAAVGELSAGQVNALQFACNKEIELIAWPALKVEQALQSMSAMEPNQGLNDVARQQSAQEQSGYYSTEENSDEPVVKFINQTLDTALQRRASDIHFEPYAQRYRIRFRIDGVLQDIGSPPPILAGRLAARLKILGQLNIAERRLPQDGQITIQNPTRSCAMRISTIPVLEGEKIVLRVMEAGNQPLDITQLGMNQRLQQDYLQALHSPQGLILVTGPTGSGKTVTLYSGLNILNQPGRNICSIEDPVEIPIEGINQTQVNVKAGLVFNQALRAFLRQDPDVIMVGEIRDRETAEIAIEAAQTGHLVMSTLHTNSTIETLVRLSQIGIPAYLIVGSLKLIIAQRLVRCLCPHCRVAEDEAVQITLPYWQGSIKNWRATGCERCLNGYYGRTGIYEMLVLNNAVRQALLNQFTLEQLESLVIKQGMEPLFMAGIRLVEQGITSLQEVYRTIGNHNAAAGDLSEVNGDREH